MAKLTKRSEGHYSQDLKPGTLVYDNAEGTGEPLKEAVFTAYGKEYETDSEGKLVATESNKADDNDDNDDDVSFNDFVEFVNPMTPGVTYKKFLKAVKASEKTVEAYLEGQLVDSEIEWIVREVKQYLINKKAKPTTNDEE